MPKVEPKDDGSDKSDSDGEPQDQESEGESGAEDDPKAPKINYSDMGKIEGYENAAFGVEADVAPPKAKELYGDKPAMPCRDISEIKEKEAREALLEFTAEHCCYGSGAAKDMKFKGLKPQTAFHYILNTYGERRTTAYESVPYKGEIVDGPENGKPPGPWEIECYCKKLFKDETRKFEIPHTSVVKPCQRCGADGRIKCPRCHGRGRVRCGCCNGRGRRRVHTQDGWRTRRCFACGGSGRVCCGRCGGCGEVQCPKCEGYAKLRVFLELTVKFKDHESDYVLEMTDLPDQLVTEVKGDVVFEQELDLVWPMTTYPVAEINNESDRLIKKHKNDYSKERILQQRQTLKAIPVTEVDCKYDDDGMRFWVYGLERKVYFPDYPQKCCWGCQIL